MALQDDIFDVQDALKGKPELKAFERLIQHMNTADTVLENQEKILSALSQGIKALRWIEKEVKE